MLLYLVKNDNEISAKNRMIVKIVFYFIIIKAESDISVGSFVAFNTLFGTFSAYVLQLVNDLVSCRNRKPDIERLKPVFNAVPEYDALLLLQKDRHAR